ncbi:MAG: hypothetical protein ACI4I5_06095 [Acutalibacteraceae bacterium]
MVKKIVVLLTVSLLCVSFAACGAVQTTQPEILTQPEISTQPETSTQAETSTQPETELTIAETDTTVKLNQALKWQALTDEIKSAYLSTVMEYRNKYGEEFIRDENGNWIAGVAFADIFDWDQDGIPELFIGYTSEKTRSAEVPSSVVSNLDVFTYQNGKVKKILSAYPGESFLQTSAQECMIITEDSDGNVYFLLNQSKDSWQEERCVQYGYTDGKITQKQFYAKAKQLDSNNIPELVSFTVQGQTVTEEEYEKEKYNGNAYLFVGSNKKEYEPLLEYLRGERENYAVSFFQEDEWSAFIFDLPDWSADLVREYR